MNAAQTHRNVIAAIRNKLSFCLINIIEARKLGRIRRNTFGAESYAGIKYITFFRAGIHFFEPPPGMVQNGSVALMNVEEKTMHDGRRLLLVDKIDLNLVRNDA